MSKSDLLAWLLTYLLHGTFLLGLAWLVSRSRLGRSSAPLSEALWRFALFASPLTALLQLAAGREPLAGRLALASPLPEPAAAVALPSSLETVVFRPEAAPWYAGLSAADAALGLWTLGALLLGLRLAWTWLRFRRRLALRPRVVTGGLREQLDRLAGEGVRLTTSSRVSVPCALGLGRGEVCVPPRALLGLSDEEQEGMLAHELAHVARRDPAWLLAVNAGCALFFFQPLNWVARRRLRELSEVLSDAQAVEQTGRPLSLARCLTEVAGWSVERLPLPVPGMADRPSHLAQRVVRLLDGATVRRVRPLWLGLGAALLLALVAVGAPGVSADGAAGSEGTDCEASAEQPAAVEVEEDEKARIRAEVAAARAEARAARRLVREAEPEIARVREELQRALEAQLAEAQRGTMTSEALRQAVEEARRHAAEQAVSSEAVRQAVEGAQRQAREAVEQALRQHHLQMEQLRRELEVETRAIAEQVRRELEKAHRERHEKRDRDREADEPDER